MRVLDRVIANSLPFVPKPIVRKVANRYIAGETLDEAMRVTAALNQNGVRATLDILGDPSPGLRRVSPDVERILGRPPRAYAEWAARNASAFR